MCFLEYGPKEETFHSPCRMRVISLMAPIGTDWVNTLSLIPGTGPGYINFFPMRTWVIRHPSPARQLQGPWFFQ